MDLINFFINILFIFFNELFSLIKLNNLTKTIRITFFFSSEFHLQSDTKLKINIKLIPVIIYSY